MNTVTDLKSEMNALAVQAPADADVRATVAARIDAHAKRRRTTALVAAAAAVVLVAGGAGIAGSVLSHRSAGPAAPTPVVSVPEVPLPPDTKLIRHQLQPVSTPVTATPPKGLTGHMWMSAPGRLAVSFFDPGARSGDSAFGWTSYTPLSTDGSGAGPATAGYTITDQRDEALLSYGPNGPAAPTVTRAEITVNGHAATLDTAPAGTDDSFGFPAGERISWQLTGGRWIHVWASGLGDKGALQQFAAGITDTPETLDRTVGIGLTLPGLTVDSSMNSWPTVAYPLGASVYLCPKGVDPMASSYSSSTGSGSSGPDGSEGSGSSSVEATSNQDPSARCITAAVLSPPVSQPGDSKTLKLVTVGDTVVHVDTAHQVGWIDLGNGVTAMAGPPRNMHLSAADLAALAASVRLSPAATMLPFPAGQGAYANGTAGTAVMSASAVPMPSPITAATGLPSSAAAPVTATTGPAAGLAPSERTGGSSAASATAAPAASAASAAASAAAARVLTTYLDALTAGDCATARRAAAASFVVGNGELCGSVRVSAHSTPENPAAPGPNEREFAITLTTGGSPDGSIPAGRLTWFYVLQRQPGGDWRIVGGGSGP